MPAYGTHQAQRIAELEAENNERKQAMAEMCAELNSMLQTVAKSREEARELARCLSYVRCDCGFRYSDPPIECALADHIEAHEALARSILARDDKPAYVSAGCAYPVGVERKP